MIEYWPLCQGESTCHGEIKTLCQKLTAMVIEELQSESDVSSHDGVDIDVRNGCGYDLRERRLTKHQIGNQYRLSSHQDRTAGYRQSKALWRQHWTVSRWPAWSWSHCYLWLEQVCGCLREQRRFECGRREELSQLCHSHFRQQPVALWMQQLSAQLRLAPLCQQRLFEPALLEVERWTMVALRGIRQAW